MPSSVMVYMLARKPANLNRTAKNTVTLKFELS